MSPQPSKEAGTGGAYHEHEERQSGCSAMHSFSTAGTETSAPVLTPMQRWMNETSQESPWNNIAEVQVGGERYEGGAAAGMDDKGSTAGTWGSKSE